jgi:hypothetical protein
MAEFEHATLRRIILKQKKKKKGEKRKGKKTSKLGYYGQSNMLCTKYDHS